MWDWIMEKNKNMLRTVWASKWYFYKNTEPQKKIRRSYKKKGVYSIAVMSLKDFYL